MQGAQVQLLVGEQKMPHAAQHSQKKKKKPPCSLVVKIEWDIASKAALAWFLIHSKHSMINNDFHSLFYRLS